MNEEFTILCEGFIANRDIVRKVFPFESMYMLPVSANVFSQQGMLADEYKLKQCKRIVEFNASIFSEFRGNVVAPVAAKLCLTSEPKEQFERVSAIYKKLKKYYHGSSYVALLASILNELADDSNMDEIIEKGSRLYSRMKENHPFLTSFEDSVMAGFLAFSQKSDDELVDDMEECYTLLREHFSNKNALQSVSHILAMGEGSPVQKVERMMQLYDRLSDAGKKYGKYFELSTLAGLSLLSDDIGKITEYIVQADDFLSTQKGYGFAGIDKKTRLMHATMITADMYSNSKTVTVAASAATIAILAAQQAAFCAVVAATSTSACAATN